MHLVQKVGIGVESSDGLTEWVDLKGVTAVQFIHE